MGTTANLHFSSALAPDNINLQWQGYNDTMIKFVSGIFEKLNAMRNDDVEEIFDQIKEKKLQEWNNHYLNQTFRRALGEFSMILGDTYEMKEKAETLKSFNYKDFKYNLARWLQSGRIMWFVYGNVSYEAAI